MAFQAARLALGLMLALPLAACQTDTTLTNVVSSYGFSRNLPPSTLYGPGSLVYRANFDPADTRMAEVRIDYLCTDRYSVALYPSPPRSSDTETQGLASQKGGSFALDLPALRSLFNVDLSANAAGSVVATIADTKILAYAPDELAEIRALLRPACRDSVQRNIKTNNAWQVAKVLQATVDLTVTLKAGASGSVKAEAVRKLVDAGFTLDAANTTLTSKGKALYYGVRLEPVNAL